MILSSLELNTTYQSNSAVDELVSVLTKGIEVQEGIAKQKKNPQRNSLALGKTYLHILESRGHLGC